ncbi:hypothetical protein V6R94_06145 [Pediococcus acidilactici]
MSKKITDENGNTYVQKKPFYKRGWFWVLAIIVIFGIGSMGKESDGTSSSSNDVATSSSVKKKVRQAMLKNQAKVKCRQSIETL